MKNVKERRSFFNVIRNGAQRCTAGDAYKAGCDARERGESREDVPTHYALSPVLSDEWESGYDETSIAIAGYRDAIARALGDFSAIGVNALYS